MIKEEFFRVSSLAIPCTNHAVSAGTMSTFSTNVVVAFSLYCGVIRVPEASFSFCFGPWDYCFKRNSLQHLCLSCLSTARPKSPCVSTSVIAILVSLSMCLCDCARPAFTFMYFSDDYPGLFGLTL